MNSTLSDSFRSMLTNNLVGNVTAIVVPWILLLLAPILVIPASTPSVDRAGQNLWPQYKWRISAIGVLIALSVGAAVWILASENPSQRFNGIMFAIFLAVLVIVLGCAICGVFAGEPSSTESKTIGIGPAVLFGITAGMFSLAGFAIGLGLFADIKSATAIPVVILFVMTAVHPYAKSIDEPIRKQLIQWMGIILGLSAVADGISMIGSH
jgi:hypothetical protein